MAKARNKTQPTSQDVQDFLAANTDEPQRRDSEALCRLMAEVTGQPPRMWGSSIIGFGKYHYKYASGREGDYLAVGFSPRKGKLVLYAMDGAGEHQALLDKLGPHSTGKACIYLKSLQSIDLEVLRELIRESYRHVMDYQHAASD